MNRLRDQFLAGAALALDQDRGTARRDLRDEVEEAKHWLALADDIFKVVALLQRALELNDFLFGAMPGNCGANVGEQLLVVPGLLDEILRAGADGVDDIAHGAERRNHDHRKFGLHLDDARQQVDTALAREGPDRVAADRTHCGVSSSMPGAPSAAVLTENPSSVSNVSSDSRIACSSSMIRILALPSVEGSALCGERTSVAI